MLQIRVNSVNPTVVMTEMGVKAWNNEKGDAMKQRIPQRKFVGKGLWRRRESEGKHQVHAGIGMA